MNADLSTTYLGLKLKNPLVVASSPLTERVDSLRRLEDSGAAAAVLPSLFEEQIEHEEMEMHRLHEFQTEAYAESLDFFPRVDDYHTDPANYLRHVEAAKRACQIPIIGSLNGSSPGGWVHYARQIEEAGADALELNIYFVPTEVEQTGDEVERRYVDLVRAVRESVSVPLAVKIGPYFTSLPNMASQLVEAGADGLVLFNRYLEPDIDLGTLHVTPHLGLSSRDEVRLPLRWIAIVRDRIETSLAATGGVHFADDLIKVLLAGADVAMIASALLRHGPRHLTGLLKELRNWMEAQEYDSVEQLKGSVSHQNCPDPSAFERANYMKALTSYSGAYI